MGATPPAAATPTRRTTSACSCRPTVTPRAPRRSYRLAAKNEHPAAASQLGGHRAGPPRPARGPRLVRAGRPHGPDRRPADGRLRLRRAGATPRRPATGSAAPRRAATPRRRSTSACCSSPSTATCAADSTGSARRPGRPPPGGASSWPRCCRSCAASPARRERGRPTRRPRCGTAPAEPELVARAELAVAAAWPAGRHAAEPGDLTEILGTWDLVTRPLRDHTDVDGLADRAERAAAGAVEHLALVRPPCCGPAAPPGRPRPRSSTSWSPPVPCARARPVRERLAACRGSRAHGAVLAIRPPPGAGPDGGDQAAMTVETGTDGRSSASATWSLVSRPAWVLRPSARAASCCAAPSSSRGSASLTA